jgi:hypothetical protein
VGQCLEHLELGDGVGLGAAERFGYLEREEAGIAESADGGGGERPQALRLLGTGRHHIADALDRSEQKGALGRTLNREGPAHRPAGAGARSRHWLTQTRATTSNSVPPGRTMPASPSSRYWAPTRA